MRRLPVYLLLDTSGSMNGEPIESVKTGLKTLISSLRQDPYALETAFLSVITFDNTAKQIVPLTELLAFQEPQLSANGGTALGEGLTLLANKVNTEIVKTTPDIKGDWKPLVFIMTDGEPTDNWKNGLAELKKCKIGVIVACAAGTSANITVLKQITENVVQLDTTDQNTIRAFFKWVSASISVGSQKIETNGKDIKNIGELPAPPPELKIITI